MFDLADEMGTLLLAEFEGGDDFYLADKSFVDNVEEEVEYYVCRLNHDPSPAFWASDNEHKNLELYLVNQSAPELVVRYVAEYEALFLDTCYNLCPRSTIISFLARYVVILLYYSARIFV